MYKYFMHWGKIREKIYFSGNIKRNLGDYMQLYILYYFIFIAISSV